MTTPEGSAPVVLVTGAAGGIGLAVAQLAARDGFRVVLTDLDSGRGGAAAAALRDEGAEAVFRRTDVTDRADVTAAVAHAVDTFGRLDAACNNAGVSEPPAALHEVDPQTWARVLSVNLTGVLWCMQAELAQMLRQGSGGSIVNVSSGAGVVAAPFQPSYTAAKHGVLGLTKVAAQEHARAGIRVNAILPGTTDTPMLRGFLDEHPGLADAVRRGTATGTLARPEQVAEAAAWLLSERAGLVSGASLVVDGGAICR